MINPLLAERLHNRFDFISKLELAAAVCNRDERPLISHEQQCDHCKEQAGY